MPLDFVEQDKAQGPVILFNADSKARPQHLETEVLPNLISKVGDEKSQRVARWMVEKYLERNVLIFDPKVLEDMFLEADYKKEGSLDTRALAIAIMGRFPKRKLTKEWRQLVSLLLGIPELILTSDIVHTKVAKNGVFNAESVWTQEPPALPPINRKRTKSAESKRSFEKPSSGKASEPGTSGSTFLAPRTAPGGTVLTSSGLRTTAQTSAEAAVNGQLASGPDGAARSTFDAPDVQRSLPPAPAAARTFKDFTQGQEVAGQVGVSPGTAALMAGTSDSWPWRTQPKPGLKAWSSALPPTAVTLSPSALASLRNSIKTTGQQRPGFATIHKALTPSDSDFKKTIGESLDVTMSLSRVEPVRPTHVPFNGDFMALGDYGSKCRTMPGFWYNEHPALPEAARQPTKYPWGEWGVTDS